MIRADRDRVLAFRLAAGHLDRRLARTLLPVAARAGLQDSAPRSAVLSLHARVDGVSATAWKDRRFAQVWGPRGAIRLVPAADAAVFTLGLLSRDEEAADRTRAASDRVVAALGGHRLTGTEVLDGIPDMEVHDLRRASRAGRIRIYWDGVDTLVWAVDDPGRKPETLRLELARRYLAVHGPSDAGEFAAWSGVAGRDAEATFAGLADEVEAVGTDRGERWILAADLPALEAARPVEGVRLLPPGDPLLECPDRATTVPDADRHDIVWPQSVPPGVLLVDGEIAGTWRRRGTLVTISGWARDVAARGAAEREAATLPLPYGRPVEVSWE
jgi:hypothetical protein